MELRFLKDFMDLHWLKWLHQNDSLCFVSNHYRWAVASRTCGLGGESRQSEGLVCPSKVYISVLKFSILYEFWWWGSKTSSSHVLFHFPHGCGVSCVSISCLQTFTFLLIGTLLKIPRKLICLYLLCTQILWLSVDLIWLYNHHFVFR